MTSSLCYATTSNASEALTQAYEFQLTAIKTQVKYETKYEDLQYNIKQYEDRQNKDFWLQVALIVAVGYAAGK